MASSNSSGNLRASYFWLIPDEPEKTDEPIEQRVRATILRWKLKEDIRSLETGSFADCVVISKDVTWKTHKVILNRCPYFSHAFRSSSGFKESLESKITIENFEPFEVSWLLQFIYGLEIDVQLARETSPNKSLLETCVLLWGIGDFFQLPDLSKSALGRLQNHCKGLFFQSRFASTMFEKIDFLPDLEAGIRAAWRHDRAAGPLRLDLIGVSVGIHPFVKDHASFIGLLDEVPEFTAQYVKALLGCPGMQRIECHLVSYAAFCSSPDCPQQLFDCDGNQVSDEVLVWAPTCLNFWHNRPLMFCSRRCYNDTVDRCSGSIHVVSFAVSTEDCCTKRMVQTLED